MTLAGSFHPVALTPKENPTAAWTRFPASLFPLLPLSIIRTMQAWTHPATLFCHLLLPQKNLARVSFPVPSFPLPPSLKQTSAKYLLGLPLLAVPPMTRRTLTSIPFRFVPLPPRTRRTSASIPFHFALLPPKTRRTTASISFRFLPVLTTTSAAQKKNEVSLRFADI